MFTISDGMQIISAGWPDGRAGDSAVNDYSVKLYNHGEGPYYHEGRAALRQYAKQPARPF